MKIYAICVVKNEADIIQYSLRHAAGWADKVIVFDNGSTDGTWEKVKELKNHKIVPFKQDNKPYSDGLRADIFNAFKNELVEGDWWVIQDSDEIFDQSPREFIQRQSGYFHHINGKKIDFCFDLNQLETIRFSGEFSKDISLFDHYTPEAWSEPRAIKHRPNLEWTEKKIWPTHMGLVCKNAINIRHYPLR
ncbi:MAG: family 2 glycosyl transferase, partial [Marivirga sp.]|nr:family 2 glycosyl transferase [Marivirga sp.]